MDSVLDQSRASDDFLALQDHQAAPTERPAWSHCLRRPDFDLVITTTLEGCTAWCRPLPTTSLCLADYEALMENPLKPYPFGLEHAGSVYQNAIHHLFADHIKRNDVTDLYMIDPTDSCQPTPVFNMVAFTSSRMIPLFWPNLSTTF